MGLAPRSFIHEDLPRDDFRRGSFGRRRPGAAGPRAPRRWNAAGKGRLAAATAPDRTNSRGGGRFAARNGDHRKRGALAEMAEIGDRIRASSCKARVPDFKRFISGAVVRAPMVAGEPLTASKIVHTDSVGFMSAIVKRGMRAVSVGISTELGAGGFILPSDRVDVIVTQQASDSSHHYSARTVLKGVRVLAVDQTYEDRDQKVVLAKTATLELTPHQAELLEGEHAAGTISLALRSLGDDGIHTTTPARDGNAERMIPGR